MPAEIEVAYHEAGHAAMSFIVGRPVAGLAMVEYDTGDHGGYLNPGEDSGFWYRAYEVDRDGDPAGEYDCPVDFGRVQPVAMPEHGNHKLIQAVVLVSVAGPVAQAILNDPDSPTLADTALRMLHEQAESHQAKSAEEWPDLKAAEHWSSYLCGGMGERRLFLDWMIERAVNLLTLPPFWAAVEALAAALLAHRNLDGAEARAIFDEATGGMEL